LLVSFDGLQVVFAWTTAFGFCYISIVFLHALFVTLIELSRTMRLYERDEEWQGTLAPHGRVLSSLH